MNALPITAAILTSGFMFFILFRIFFDDADDFWESVKYSFTPDIFSWMNGELQRDFGKSLKLGIYILICGGSGYGVFLAVQSFVN